MKRRSLVVAGLMLLPLAAAAAPGDPPAAPRAPGQMTVAGQTALVMAGPSSSLADQLRYLRQTWPEQHAVAVVTTAVDATCRGTGQPAGSGGHDCNVRVVPKEYLAVRWLDGSPPGPAALLLMTFGYAAAEAPFPIKIGSDFLALLAPTRDRGIYAATLLAPASETLVREVRAALREVAP